MPTTKPTTLPAGTDAPLTPAEHAQLVASVCAYLTTHHQADKAVRAVRRHFAKAQPGLALPEGKEGEEGSVVGLDALFRGYQAHCAAVAVAAEASAAAAAASSSDSSSSSDGSSSSSSSSEDASSSTSSDEDSSSDSDSSDASSSSSSSSDRSSEDRESEAEQPAKKPQQPEAKVPKPTTPAATPKPASNHHNKRKAEAELAPASAPKQAHPSKRTPEAKAPSPPARFQRVRPEEVEFADESLRDNRFVAKGGTDPNSYGYKAHVDLIKTRGAGFRKEKDKKKRGSYRGGQIDLASHSIKFANSDSE